MKIRITKENLMLAIKKVEGAVGNKQALPILANILLETENDTLKLTATDLELTISASVPAEIIEQGATTLPARKFSQIIGALPSGDVEFVSKDDFATISCQRSVFKIKGTPAIQFQKPEEFETDWSFTMPTSELIKSIQKVSYARSADDGRGALVGVLFSVREGSLTIAATDGRRLALVEKPLENASQIDGDIILPYKVTIELPKALSCEETTVHISNSVVKLETADTVIVSRLLEGVYPNYRQVIPAGFANHVEIPRLAFMDALRRVSLVISGDMRSVKLSLKENTLDVSGGTSDVGEASEPVDVDYTSDPIVISFNPDFFTEPLKLLECDRLTMNFNDDLTAVKITGDEGFIYILMPMRN